MARGADRWAAGTDVGFSNPIGDDDFDTELVLGGYLEFLQTERVSWRGTLSYHSFEGPDGAKFSGENQLDIWALHGNAVYRWRGGVAHPFVIGGVGVYRYEPEGGRSDREFGVDFGGGVSFFMVNSPDARPRIAVKVEGLFHGTSGSELDSFFDGTVGVRLVW